MGGRGSAQLGLETELASFLGCWDKGLPVQICAPHIASGVRPYFEGAELGVYLRRRYPQQQMRRDFESEADICVYKVH